MARRRGSLLLVAFIAGVIASGGGGVRAPWLPRPTHGEPTALSVANAMHASNVSTWRMHRME